MLKEINCSLFIDESIVFNSGLNTVLGDKYSTNSIGKSTLLMIIDFIFGGGSYLERDSGTTKELGHHSFNFQFIFGIKKYYFTRSTSESNVVSICDSEYNMISKIDTKSYTNKLKDLYVIANELSFRSTVNPYSRIWGKDNYNGDKPIQNHIKDAESIAINNLIKLFNLFSTISSSTQEIKNQEESRKIITGLHKKNYIQKVTKTQFKKNEKEVSIINDEIKKIQDNLLKFTLNIEELSSKELIELKTQKKRLLDSQSLIQNKIRRLDINLEKKGTKSKYFKRLSDFFENPNEEKIEEIEIFHSKISSILTRELNASRQLLIDENKIYETEISVLNIKISSLLENVKSPKFIVEKIYDLTIEANKLLTVNKFHQEKEDVIEEIKKLTESLDDTIKDILSKIQEKINNELIRINKEIHTGNKKTPSIKLNRKSYIFDHSSNTGTGKSFADLIEFDLTILKLTDLPFLIHDSVLFKNIEDFAIDKIIEQYMNFEKQIFIALDGINKYSSKSQESLINNKVIKLSESRKLFDSDWR